jgi:DNA-binding response OmpR family regulator
MRVGGFLHSLEHGERGQLLVRTAGRFGRDSRLTDLVGLVAPRRLLVVEDDKALARALARLLRSYGHDVYLAETCSEARAAPGRFSLSVFDIDLPDGDGVDLARELLDSGKIKRAVFFTGANHGSISQRAAGYGPIITKTRGVAVLRIAIETLLEDEAAQVVGTPERQHDPSSTAPPPSAVKHRRN